MTALQREWAAKLKASGFDDIESGEDGMLSRSRAETGRVTHDEHVQTASYYQRAGVMLHHRRWSDLRERRIWELHSEGIGMNEIARSVKAGNTLVHATINRLAAEMMGGKRGKRGKRGGPYRRNDRTWWRWLEQQAQKLSDSDLMAMAPTLLQLAQSTPKLCSTKS